MTGGPREEIQRASHEARVWQKEPVRRDHRAKLVALAHNVSVTARVGLWRAAKVTLYFVIHVSYNECLQLR